MPGLMLTGPSTGIQYLRYKQEIVHKCTDAPTCKKCQGLKFTDSLVSEGSVIGDSSITRSVIGIRSRIGNHTTIRDSVLLGADYYPLHGLASSDRTEGPETAPA